MTHDPLCDPRSRDYRGPYKPCDCDLIARVREDERQQLTRKVWESSGVQTYRYGYAAALRDCEEAVKALPPITDAYPTSSPAGGEGLSIVTRTWLCNRDAAVAAIEALSSDPAFRAHGPKSGGE